MSEVQLGSKPLESSVRDAIHIAVVPVVASEMLRPGQKVGVSEGRSVSGGKMVGIVDPYLDDVVPKGGLFWLCLFPNTVTGMRHHWCHPDFETDDIPSETKHSGPTKEESEAWLREYIENADCPDYETVLAAAVGDEIECVDPVYYGTYENDGEYLFFSGRDAHGEIPAEFWDHVENVTGKICELRAKCFSCSC